MPGPQRVSVLRRKGQVFSGSCLCLSPAEDQAEELRPGLATVEPWVSPFLSESRFPSGCPGMRLGHLAEGQQLVEVWKAVVGVLLCLLLAGGPLVVTLAPLSRGDPKTTRWGVLRAWVSQAAEPLAPLLGTSTQYAVV